MKIENQVCTLKQAKKFEKLGINAHSIFYWHFDSGMKWRVLPDGYFYTEEEGVEYYPAYTTSELGVMLPTCYDTMRTDEGWRGYDDNGNDVITEAFWNTEAGARADIILFLVKNNIITPEEINQRILNS